MKLQQHSRRDFSSTLTHLGVSIKANEAAGELEQPKPELEQQRVPGAQQPREEAVRLAPALPRSTTALSSWHTQTQHLLLQGMEEEDPPESPSADTQSLG